MYLHDKEVRVRNVRELKKFLETIPDDIPVRGVYHNSPMHIFLCRMVKRKWNEFGPRRILTFLDLKEVEGVHYNVRKWEDYIRKKYAE